MKGIILSAVLWIHSMVVVVGLIWMVNYEYTRYHVISSHKQALRSTMETCKGNDCDEEEAMKQFSLFLKPSLRNYSHASWDLMGFHQEPLLLRFKVQVDDNTSIYPFSIISDEAMIQEIDYDE